MSVIQASLRNDVPTNAASVPMSTYVEEPAAIRGRFNWVSYGKSGTVLSMFQQALTPKVFHKGLQYYLNDMYYRAGEPEDLFRGIQRAYTEESPAGTLSIASAMGSWVYQAGYPLVSIEKSGNNFVLTQARYPTGNGEIYAIPLTHSTRASPAFERKTPTLWLRSATMTVPQSQLGVWGNDWIVLNNQQSGFYRVNYDDELWMAIRDGLRENSSAIHLTNRRVLQEELNIGVAVTNQLLASTVLEFLSYLTKEENYLVWNDANANFALLNRTLYRSEVYGSYMDFIVQLTRAHLTRVGYEAINGEEIAITQLRARVKLLNCYAFDPNCLQHELNKLMKYNEDENGNPAPDFCSALRLADQEIYDHYLNELVSNSTLKNRNLIARTIHCSNNRALLGVLTLVVEEETNILTPAERVTIINNLLANEFGFEAAIEYLERNYEKINSFRVQLGNLINDLNTYQRLNVSIEKAVSEEFLTIANAAALRTSIENNLRWQNKHLQSVKLFFSQLDTTTSSTTSSSTEIPITTTTTSTTTPSGVSGLIISLTLVITSVLLSILSN